ncbi:MAG: EAL domain-containing protein [Mycobacterium sp.]
MRFWRLQVALLAVIAGFVVTKVPGLRAEPGFSWWMDGIWQNLAYLAAAVLCVVRTPARSPDRVAWRIVALGLVLFCLANTYLDWFVRPRAIQSVPSLGDGLWLAAYLCAYVVLVLFMRRRVARLPVGLWLDGVVVGLGTATVGAAVVVPQLMAHLDRGAAGTAVTVAYAIANLLLLALVVFAMSLFQWRPPVTLWWLGGGLALYGVVDSLYVIRAARGTHEPGGWLDAAWVVAATLVALAPGWIRSRADTRPPPVWAPLAAPLLAAAAAVGVQAAGSFVAMAPVAEWLAVATMFAALARLAVAFFEARRAGEHAHLARTDDLTGVLNRRGFYDRASETITRKDPSHGCEPSCALLLLDLNHFKDVNDSLGHAAGDELLRVVSARLTASLNDDDVVGRLGGDEFALLISHVDTGEAARTAAALIDILEEGVELDGVEVHADASIGIAVSPDHGSDVGTLLRCADIAMYQAKQAHVSQMIYTVERHDHGTTRAGMELRAQLRRAIDHGELAVHYQPQMVLRTGEVIGAEALVRWPHPSRGLLYPDQFLPLARNSSLMRSMTEFVLERALRDASLWHAEGHHVRVAVNLSPPTFADRDLPTRIAQALKRHGLQPGDLAVEITEDFMLAHLERARTVLGEIRRHGVTIAIDDFGSGYSSLSYLRDLPIDEVKLDRSFVAPITTDPDAAAIVQSVIYLAHSLRLTTVAEGVETAAAAAALTAFGCDAVQGHYYSAALSTSQFLWLLEGFAPHQGDVKQVVPPA